MDSRRTEKRSNMPLVAVLHQELKNHRLKVKVPQRRYQFFRLRQEECRKIQDSCKEEGKMSGFDGG